MEQECQSWKSLDPMYFWPLVMRWKNRVCPRIVIKGNSEEEFLEQISKHPEMDFVIEDSESLVAPRFNNLVYRWRNKMSYKSWVDEWARVDYLVCDENDKDYWMQAGLCGVKVFFSWEKFVEALNRGEILVLSKIDRIDQWEMTKNLLT